MVKCILPLSYVDFTSLVSIRFDNILDGFNNYLNSNLSSSSDNPLDKDKYFIDFLTKLFELNNNEIILDFFINKLSSEEIDTLRTLLITEDKLMLNSILDSIHVDTSYFIIKDKSLIPFFTRLSTHEIFFCTMYFNNIGITIWGNYNYTFPCFFNNENTLVKIKNIASDYNLIL